MRLFVAVELDAAMHSAADAAASQLRERLAGALPARWVSTANMHLTVRFIGHVADDRVPVVLDALEPPLAIAPFDVALGECGVFPSHGPPRVMWIGLQEGLSSLRAMHEECNRRLRPLGLEPEDRPYSAHLTLARLKDPPRGSAALVREAIGSVRVPAARCHVSAATLFESRLSPKGSTYNPRLRIPLRAIGHRPSDIG